MLSPYEGGTVLDVGGGHGQMVEPLIRNGYRVTVLGSSPLCRERIIRFTEDGRCGFIEGDLLKIPCMERSFDIVISFRQLAHIKEWRGFISELTRVARKAVVVDFPSIRSLNYIGHIFPAFFRLKKGIEADTRPYTLFRESELIEVFRTNKFIYSDRFSQFFLPMFLHRRLKLPAISIPIENLFRISGLTAIFGSPVIIKFVRKDS